MIPTSPVCDACVPPHGVKSKFSISIKRRLPSRAGSFRKGSCAASSGVTSRVTIGRSSQMTLFASSTARSIRSSVGLMRSTSISQTCSMTRKLRVGASNKFTNACDKMCCPECCWMWSRRRGQSTRPLTVSPIFGVGPWMTCRTVSPSSVHSTTRALPSEPVSLG